MRSNLTINNKERVKEVCTNISNKVQQLYKKKCKELKLKYKFISDAPVQYKSFNDE